MALFPPKEDGESKEGNSGAAGADAAREEVRALIRGQMEKGEISGRPEEELSGRG